MTTPRDPLTSTARARRAWRRSPRPSHVLPLVLALAISVLGQHAGAQNAVAVEPPVLMHTSSPGQTITTDLKLFNPSSQPIRVRAYLSDWQYSPSGEISYPEVGKVKRSASPWASFSPSEVVLQSGQRSSVKLSVSVPKDATPGSHWGVLFFEAEDLNPPPGKAIATLKVRVAHSFYVNIPAIQTSGKITGIFGKPPAASGKPYTFAVQYANSGNAAQQVLGLFEVRDRTGKRVAYGLIDKQVVLPDSSRVFQVSLNGPLPAGTYSVLVVLNYGDSTKDVAGDYVFTLKAPLAEPTSGSSPAVPGTGG